MCDEFGVTSRGRIRGWNGGPLTRERPAPAKNARAGCPRTSGRDARATSRDLRFHFYVARHQPDSRLRSVAVSSMLRASSKGNNANSWRIPSGSGVILDSR
jgi:hypothetical protein